MNRPIEKLNGDGLASDQAHADLYDLLADVASESLDEIEQTEIETPEKEAA
jgi:hypothetical protein